MSTATVPTTDPTREPPLVTPTGTGWPNAPSVSGLSTRATAPHRVAAGRGRGRTPSRPAPEPASAPVRFAHDAGASLIRRSPRHKRTVTKGYYPPITLRPAPSFDPPYVDEPGADEWYREAAGQLAFDFSALTRRPEQVVDPPTTAAQEPRLTASPEARHAAGRFARACLEILNGYRPVAHVRSLSRPTNAHALVEQLLDALGRMPITPTIPRRQQQPDLVRLRRLRISEPAPGIIEAAAALGTDARTWAMAFRLEHTSKRWLGTVLQVL
ncbi:hypothetical protein SAMN05421812_102388 [Asanoa hainanensis]|uniref:Uncharacterized protein n=1 Tax=Asanoa hainanensis TaxID=560556 RepID=A0A239IH00_9ACTN|nr:Rv3235 family protein [Asanoa hainanensis]SNS92702.1 hypothetical protein SAMN05421812_102388 [Asanoa hainanensis]